MQEVNDADEAANIATFYRLIMSKIQKQRSATPMEKAEKDTKAELAQRQAERGESIGMASVQAVVDIMRDHLRECDLDELASHVESITGAQAEYAGDDPYMETMEIFRTENYMGMLDNVLHKSVEDL